jgi:hypothetical protein
MTVIIGTLTCYVCGSSRMLFAVTLLVLVLVPVLVLVLVLVSRPGPVQEVLDGPGPGKGICQGVQRGLASLPPAS